MRIRFRQQGESEWQEIRDLYWFEENGVREIDVGVAIGIHGEKYEFEVNLGAESSLAPTWCRVHRFPWGPD